MPALPPKAIPDSLDVATVTTCVADRRQGADYSDNGIVDVMLYVPAIDPSKP